MVIAGRVLEFRNAAEAFRAAIEGATDAESGAEYARRLRNAVARVYLAAALLDRGSFSDTDPDPPHVDMPGTRDLKAAVRDRLGSGDLFVDVWDPTEPEETDPIRRSLAQELLEIYEDLGVALALLGEPERQNPVWDVREGFEIHWGKHAVDVLRPLHHVALLGVAGVDY